MAALPTLPFHASILVDDQEYFELVIETARSVTGETPCILRNPWTGAIFWVQGMHNCPREMFADAAARLGRYERREVKRALIH